MAQIYPQRRAGSAFLWGIIFGLVAIAFDLLTRFFLPRLIVRTLRFGHATVARTVGVVTLTAAILFLIGLICYFLAGLLAARRSRTFEAGVFAGLIAGALVEVYRLILASAIGQIGVGRFTVGRSASLVTSLIVTLAVATGLAALGALIGRGRRGANAPLGGAPYGAPYSPSYPYQASGDTPMQGYATPAQSFMAPGTFGASNNPYPPAESVTPTPQSYPSRGNDYPTIQSQTPQQEP